MTYMQIQVYHCTFILKLLCAVMFILLESIFSRLIWAQWEDEKSPLEISHEPAPPSLLWLVHKSETGPLATKWHAGVEANLYPLI